MKQSAMLVISLLLTALSNSAGEVETLSKQALQILLESAGKSAAAQAR